MKFLAVSDFEGQITMGRVYFGSFISVVSERNQKPETTIKIIIWDDRGQWSTWLKSRFAPAQDQ